MFEFNPSQLVINFFITLHQVVDLFSCISSLSALKEVVNRTSDGGITALHMAALNGHVDSVQLLLDLGASASQVTVEDGTTIDLIGKLLFVSLMSF